MTKRIVVLVKTISRNNGGASTALDLSEALHLLGYDVHIGLVEGHLQYLLKGREKVSTRIPTSKLFTIPPSYARTPTPGLIGSSESLKRRGERQLAKALLFVGQRPRKFKALLSDTDVIIYAGGGFTGEAMADMRSLTKAKIVRNHAGSPDTYENISIQDSHVLGTFPSKRERYVAYCRSFDGILFQAQDQADECIARDKSLAPLVYVVQPSCEEGSVLGAVLDSNPYGTSKRNIVSVGSIQPRKNQHAAFEAFASLATDFPDAELHFVGGKTDSEYGRSLRSMIEASPFRNRVHLHGHRADYLRYIAHAYLMVQSSHAEGVSRVLREAMLLKTPIVSFAISGTSSILTNQREALLVPPGATAELGGAMRALFDEPELAQSLAAAAYNKYLTRHSWPAYAAALSQMVTNVCARE